MWDPLNDKPQPQYMRCGNLFATFLSRFVNILLSINFVNKY
jgi:hypothetical protein